MNMEIKYLLKIFLFTFILVFGCIWLYSDSNQHPLNQKQGGAKFIYQQF